MAFTLAGITSGNAPVAAGGFMVTDSAGDITNASTEDYNVRRNAFSVNASPFTGSYAAGGTGRYTLTNFSGFIPAGLTFAAYPSSGGLLLLEIDNLGITTGAAYTADRRCHVRRVARLWHESLGRQSFQQRGSRRHRRIHHRAPAARISSGIIDENSAQAAAQPWA